MSDMDTQAAQSSAAGRPLEDESQPGEGRSGGTGGSRDRDQSNAGGTPETDPPPLQHLPYDTVFDLLSNERRRFTLRYLDEHGSGSLGELAEILAARENDKPRERITSQERKRTYVGLYQCHFPKLEDAGVIRTDRSVRVELGPNADQLLRHLGADRDRHDDESRPSLPYTIAAAVGILGLGLWFLLPGSWVGALVVGCALACVLAITVADHAGVQGLSDVGPDVSSTRALEAIRQLKG